MSNTKIIKPELADAAAEWWTDKLRGDVKQDNGDAFGSALGTVTRKKIHGEDGIDEDKLDAFEELLADRLTTEERRGKNLYVGVDYGPGSVLAEPAEAAGIDVGTSTFPWKTGMWIEAERILVSEGHRSDREEIYSTDAWPPTVREIQADQVEFTIEIPPYRLEESDPVDEIEVFLAKDEYQGFDYCIRSLQDIQILDAEMGEDKHGSEVLRADVTCAATVFISRDYIEQFEAEHEHSVVHTARKYLGRDTATDLSEQTHQDLVADAFEAFSHLGLSVDSVSVREGYDIEAW